MSLLYRSIGPTRAVRAASLVPFNFTRSLTSTSHSLSHVSHVLSRVSPAVTRSTTENVLRLGGNLPLGPFAPQLCLTLTRSFTASAVYQKDDKTGSGTKEEQKSENKNEQAGREETKEEAPAPPHGDKTPWQVFMGTLRSEFKASKEWNESTKALASSAQEFSENENVRRARTAYETASSAATTKTSKTLKKTGSTIGKGAAWAWDSALVKGIRAGASATGKGIDKVTRPVRETEAYKSVVGNVKDAMDDGSSTRYGGWMEREERRKRRAIREAKQGTQKVEPIEEDPNAGTNITLHKDSAWKEQWRNFKDNSPLVHKYLDLKNVYQESENPLISTARSWSDAVSNFFAENETAHAIKRFRQMDPNFMMEPFLRDLREYILPEILDSYVKGDSETLKLWLSDAQYHVYDALTKQYRQVGLKSDGRILDIRHVDVAHARLLEPGEIPVFVITCRTQEVHVFRQSKTNEPVQGMEDKVQLVIYAIVMTRVPEDVNNKETRGWRVIELQKANRDYI